MRSISASVFEKFVGYAVESFLPSGINPDDLDSIEVRRTMLVNLVTRVPQDQSWTGSLVDSRKLVMYFAICNDGEVLDSPAPELCHGSNYAHDGGTTERDGTALGDAWGERIGEIRYIVQYDRELNDCNDRYTNYRNLILHLVRESEMERIAKIRRRAEDALRKSDPTVVLRVASILGVRTDE